MRRLKNEGSLADLGHSIHLDRLTYRILWADLLCLLPTTMETSTQAEVVFSGPCILKIAVRISTLLIVTLRMERGCLTLTTSTVLEAC
jgi:hypothetical protein